MWWGRIWVLRTSRPEIFGVRMAKFRESTAGEKPRYLLCLVSSSKQLMDGAAPVPINSSGLPPFHPSVFSATTAPTASSEMGVGE